MIKHGSLSIIKWGSVAQGLAGDRADNRAAIATSALQDKPTA